MLFSAVGTSGVFGVDGRPTGRSFGGGVFAGERQLAVGAIYHQTTNGETLGRGQICGETPRGELLTY